MTPPPEIKLSDRLQGLVLSCEKNCVADCCGLDAFDFAPLHVASYLSAFSGRITEHNIAEWEAELQKAADLLTGLQPNEEGFLCSVAGMNQYFRRADFEAFLTELRHSIRVSPEVVGFSDRLRHEA